MAIVVLEASDEYLFVETGPDGEVEHLKPNLVAGEKQHMIVVKLHFDTIVNLEPDLLVYSQQARKLRDNSNSIVDNDRAIISGLEALK